MLNLDNELILFEKYKITPNELTIIELIQIAVEENDMNPLVKFCKISDEHRLIFRNTLASLQNKGIILKSYKLPKEGDVFEPEDVEFNKNFIKMLFKASFDMGEELFNNYPTFTIINGATVGLKGVAKKFNSLEDFYTFYGKQIRWKPEKHQEVLEIVQWGKDNNIINESIASFVINNSWNTLKEMREGNGTNINYDAVKLL